MLGRSEFYQRIILIHRILIECLFNYFQKCLKIIHSSLLSPTDLTTFLSGDKLKQSGGGGTSGGGYRTTSTKENLF